MDKLIGVYGQPAERAKFIHKINLCLESGKTYEMVSRKPFNGTMDLFKYNPEVPDAITILTFNRTMDKVLLQKEWRYPVQDFIYEFPAGLLDTNDNSPKDTAKRELMEETGLYIIEYIDYLPAAYQSAGMTNETTGLVICKADGEITRANLQEGEDIYPEWVDRNKAMYLIRSHKMSVRAQSILYMWCYGGNINEY